MAEYRTIKTSFWNDPETNRRVIYLNKMNKKFWNFKRAEASSLLQRGFRIGGEDFYEELEDLISINSGSWYQVKPEFECLVCGWES